MAHPGCAGGVLPKKQLLHSLKPWAFPNPSSKGRALSQVEVEVHCFEPSNVNYGYLLRARWVCGRAQTSPMCVQMPCVRKRCMTHAAHVCVPRLDHKAKLSVCAHEPRMTHGTMHVLCVPGLCAPCPCFSGQP